MIRLFALKIDYGRSVKISHLTFDGNDLTVCVTLQDVDCAAGRNLSKNQLAVLGDVAWIGRGENALITGATGCGKSHLACELGNHACTMSQRTLYFNMNHFCEQIAGAILD
jgi:DNA replication protein DnaC